MAFDGEFTNLNYNSSTQGGDPLGKSIRVIDPATPDKGTKEFRFIKMRVAAASGDTIGLSATNPATWYGDITFASSPAYRGIGVAFGTIGAGNYGWIQIRGYIAAVTITSASPTIAQPLAPKAGATGAIIVPSSGTANDAACVIGTCAASGSSVTTIDAYLNCG